MLHIDYVSCQLGCEVSHNWLVISVYKLQRLKHCELFFDIVVGEVQHNGDTHSGWDITFLQGNVTHFSGSVCYCVTSKWFLICFKTGIMWHDSNHLDNPLKMVKMCRFSLKKLFLSKLTLKINFRLSRLMFWFGDLPFKKHEPNNLKS